VLRPPIQEPAIDDKLCSLDVGCLIRRKKEDRASYIFGPTAIVGNLLIYLRGAIFGNKLEPR
jgi:hypothetical protein